MRPTRQVRVRVHRPEVIGQASVHGRGRHEDKRCVWVACIHTYIHTYVFAYIRLYTHICTYMPAIHKAYMLIPYMF